MQCCCIHRHWLHWSVLLVAYWMALESLQLISILSSNQFYLFFFLTSIFPSLSRPLRLPVPSPQPPKSANGRPLRTNPGRVKMMICKTGPCSTHAKRSRPRRLVTRSHTTDVKLFSGRLDMVRFSSGSTPRVCGAKSDGVIPSHLQQYLVYTWICIRPAVAPPGCRRARGR